MPLTPKRRTAPELLDFPLDCYTIEELEGSLADIRVVNRYLGDNRAVLKHLSRVVGSARDSLTVLDVGTGSADIPVAICDWAQQAGIRVKITGIDSNEQTIGIAGKWTRHNGDIHLEVADGLGLPYPDGSFDFVLCSKTLHHLTEEQAVQLIREAARVARSGYMILDLRRSWIACLLIYVLTRIFTRNRLTRNDGPLSVLRAFTPEELTRLATAAGVSAFAIHREPFWLMALTGGVR